MSQENLHKILFVDDEPNVLSGIKRQLRGKYDIYTAESGAEGLDRIKQDGPFLVVVSDMRMPKMNGAEFLAAVKKASSNTIRILLTGQTDIDSAVAAINEGEIFRFLLKPCPTDALINTLDAAIEQARLLRVEKELLEKTLQGSIKVLTDILSLVNPVAFSRSSKIRQYIKHMTAKQKLGNKWQYDVAAMLCQTGCITIPSDILLKIYANEVLSDKEQSLFDAHPKIGHDLIAKIPRLKMVAQIIQHQQYSPKELSARPITDLKPEILGGQMLKIALYLDSQMMAGESLKSALNDMYSQTDDYHPGLIALLNDIESEEGDEAREMVSVRKLTTMMIIDEDIIANNGALIVSKGQEVSEAMLARLQIMSENEAIKEPFRVIVK